MSPYGVPMPQGVPMPSGVPMSSGPAAAPMGAPATPGPSPYLPAGAAPAAPVAAPMAPAPGPGYPLPGAAPIKRMTVGQNGFGLHPEVGHDDLVNYLLPRFKNVESSGDPGNYIGKHLGKAYDPSQSASGLYGYTEGTWNHYMGFPRAMDAPPEVQEQRMQQDLMGSVRKFGGDLFKAVASHYYPKFATDPTKWEDTIRDKYGNPTQTVRQYLEKVLPAERVERYLNGVRDSSGPSLAGRPTI